MKSLYGILILLILLAFALPALLGAVQSLIIPAIIVLSLVGILKFLVSGYSSKRRRW